MAHKDILEFSNDGWVHYFDCGDSLIGVYICKNIKLSILNLCNSQYELYLNKAVFKSTKFMKDSERLKNCHSLEENRNM